MMADEKKDGGSIAIDQGSSNTDIEPGQVLAERQDEGWFVTFSPRIYLPYGSGALETCFGKFASVTYGAPEIYL